MSNPMPVGTTKGPGETPHEYVFVAADPEQLVKYGEFVYYETAVEGETRPILGRVSKRVPLRLYPDTFLSDPTVSPAQVADLLGYDHEPHELFEITVAILGYFDPVMGFVNPRVPPPSGTPIYVATNEHLGQVLCRLRTGEIGGVHIGSLLSRPRGAVPIVLDARGFTSTHMAIIASTGSGKSYLAGVVLEELMRPNNRAAVLVIDPHAEYDTLTEMQGHPGFRSDGYEPRVKIVRPNDIKVRVSSLELGTSGTSSPTSPSGCTFCLARHIDASPTSTAASGIAATFWSKSGLESRARLSPIPTVMRTRMSPLVRSSGASTSCLSTR